MPATLHHASDVPNFEPNRPQLATTPDYELPGGQSALEERARQIGAALGRTVAAFRNTGSRIKNTANQATDTAASQIAAAKQQIRTGYADTKAQAERLVHDYPWHVVLGAGVLGLVLGAGMRLWRANR